MTTAYRSLSRRHCAGEYAEVSARFDALRELGLALNMARGKPGKGAAGRRIRHIDHTT